MPLGAAHHLPEIAWATASRLQRGRAEAEAEANNSGCLMRDSLEVLRSVNPGDGVIVALSGGKDSIAVLDLCRQHFKRVEAYHLYAVPGIGFVNRYLDYLERRYEISIVRRPGELLPIYLRQGIYRATSLNVPAIRNGEIEADERRRTGIPWIASGIRKADSLERRGMLSAWGCVAERQGKLFPIGEWSDAQVGVYLRTRGVYLPPDYSLWKRSWGYDLSGMHLAAIRKRWPDDFATIKRYFPLCETEADRWEMLHGEEEKAARDFAGNRRGAPARRKRKPAAPGAGTDPLPEVSDDAGTPVDAKPSGVQPAHD